MSYRMLGIDGKPTWHKFQNLCQLPRRVRVYAPEIPSTTLPRRARSFLDARCWAVLYLARLYIMGGVARHTHAIITQV